MKYKNISIYNMHYKKVNRKSTFQIAKKRLFKSHFRSQAEILR